MKSIWLTSYWDGLYYQIIGKTVRIYGGFERVKANAYVEEELQGELMQTEPGVYEFSISGAKYTAQLVLDVIKSDIEQTKERLNELKEQEAYFKSL